MKRAPSSGLLRKVYAQDASIYHELPDSVEFPRNADDIIKLVKKGSPLIPRAAGTSLAGQVVGSGIVLDTGKYLNKICSVNIEEKWVETEPGVIRDELNEFLKSHGLFFGPITSTSNRCMIGGMVGNNSSGSNSLKYGTTRDKILGVEMVTSDGILRSFGEINSEGKSELPETVIEWINNWGLAWQQGDLISNFPDKGIHRRNTGYAIDILAAEKSAIVKVLCGSEGTLGIMTKFRLALDYLPEEKLAVVALHYSSIDSALAVIPELMKSSPYQLELIDRIILECSKLSREYERYGKFVKGDPAAILLIEVRAKNDNELKFKVSEISNNGSFDRSELYGNESENVWKLRAAGLGLLSNVPGDAKPIACIEDTAVRIDVLRDYIKEVDVLLNKFGLNSIYYAHAGAGELHLRPILNLKTKDGVQLLIEISKATADLVKKYRGSLSGEHGDGRVRSPFMKEFYGEEVYAWMQSFKQAWDPNNIMNPYKIIGAKPINDNLRYKEGHREPVLHTFLNFTNEGGILRAIEKCNGSGDCRRLSFSGALMCPSYMASRNEWDSTRGRANVLRIVLTNQGMDGFKSSELTEAMAHCVGCKGCSQECPSSVDMAAIKLEYLYQNRHNRKIIDYLFSNVHKIFKVQYLRFIINPMLKLSIIKRAFGISVYRSIPIIKSGRLLKFNKKQYSLDSIVGSRPIILWVDEFTALYEPELIGKACEILKAFGFSVGVFYSPSGRALLSGGYLPEAKKIAEKFLEIAENIYKIHSDVPIVGLEPSAILSLKDEYLMLLDGLEKEKLKKIINNFSTIDAFLAKYLTNNFYGRNRFKQIDGKILLHVHCHQKSLESIGSTAFVLKSLLNAEVVELKSSCCGMAGSYGIKTENQQMSLSMFNLVIGPSIRDFEDHWVVATGISCRHQIREIEKKDSLHLIEILWLNFNH